MVVNFIHHNYIFRFRFRFLFHFLLSHPHQLPLTIDIIYALRINLKRSKRVITQNWSYSYPPLCSAINSRL